MISIASMSKRREQLITPISHRHGRVHCARRHLPRALAGAPSPLPAAALSVWLTVSLSLRQARASLKNPSRPYTPRTAGRSLFHGEDYRPGSRPSSSYSVAEQKQIVQEERQRKQKDAAPSASMLPKHSKPPRPPAPATEPASLKLAQAPAENQPDEEEFLDASMELPSQVTRSLCHCCWCKDASLAVHGFRPS